MALIKQITKRRFDAYCYIRSPHLRIFSDEVAWFEAYDKKLIGVVTLDYTDNDYGFVVLGRDKRKVFRGIDVSLEFFATKLQAERALMSAFEKYENDGLSIYPQLDEKKLPNEILIPQVKDEKLHPYFKLLITAPRFEAAKNLINEIAYSFVDVDGNYIKDFQTTGFDGRIWELYLYMYLHTAGFSINNSFVMPDYNISYFGKKFCIEAVTVNPSNSFDEELPTSEKDLLNYTKDYLPIKFGSPLYSKLQKKYWELEHVKGNPLIIAIHDYHMPGNELTPSSMVWSRTALSDYLYGARMKTHVDDNGKVLFEVNGNGKEVWPELESIESHTWKNKTIPSNFFEQEGSENISAVLFSNNATISAFSRMGKLAGLGSADIEMIRKGTAYNPDPLSTMPLTFTINVDSPDYEEAWADGLVMYHNPNAKHPIDRSCFNEISHIYYDKVNKVFPSFYQPFDVMASITLMGEKR